MSTRTVDRLLAAVSGVLLLIALLRFLADPGNTVVWLIVGMLGIASLVQYFRRVQRKRAASAAANRKPGPWQ